VKIRQPTLLPDLPLASLEDLTNGDIEEAHLYDIDATNCHITSASIVGVLLEKVLLSGALIERISARDLIAKQTDLSAATVSNGSINRAKFDNCRMSGVDMNKTTVHDVVFSGCKLDMANFRFADLRRVTFVDCILTEADFLGASLHDVTFVNSLLERTVFDQAKCKLVDLRSSQLYELSGWSSLRGATIDSVQLAEVAPYLARQLGIFVQNEV